MEPARFQGPTERGAFLDITCDFLSIARSFSFCDPRSERGFGRCILLFSFVGTGSSFLAFSISAARHRLENKALKEKSIYYLQGLTEGFETTVVLLLMCLIPEWFEWLAWGFGIVFGDNGITYH